MAMHLRVLVVVQSGAAHQSVLHGKAQGFYQMQGASRVGGKANDVARIGRDFRFYQDDVKHGVGV